MVEPENSNCMYEAVAMYCLSCQIEIRGSKTSNLISKAGEVLVQFCSQCSLGSTLQMPKVTIGFRRFGPFIELSMKFFRLIRAVKVSSLYLFKRGLSILDCGCGRGEFLQYMRFFGWEVTGTEYSLDSSVEVRKKRIPVLLGKQSTEFKNVCGTNKFNVITSFHILEHISNPVGFLEQCWQTLKINGELIIEVPNIESMQFRFAKEQWILLDLENHRYHFSRKSLNMLLEHAGFHVISTSTFSLNYGVLGMIDAMRVIFHNSFVSGLGKFGNETRTIEKRVSSIWILLGLIPGFFMEIFAAICGKGSVIRVRAIRKNLHSETSV